MNLKSFVKSFFVLLLIGSLFTACDNKNDTKVEKDMEKMGDAIKKESEELKMEIKKTQDKIDARLEELDAQMEEASDEAKADIEQRMAKLKTQREKLDQQLENFGDRVENDWDGFKSAVNDAINEIQVELEN